MKRKRLTGLLIGEVCLFLILAGVVLWLHFGRAAAAVPEAETTAATEESTTAPPATKAPTTAAATEAPTTVAPTEAPTTEVPTEVIYNLTFAGDCTLGTLYQYYSAASCFPSVVGENYEYPFAGVQDWFATDDFTMVNLEGPLTNEGTPAIKTFTMRGDPKLVNILPAGNVECVSLANNHTLDFGTIGYENTKKALDSVGIYYAGNGEACLIETGRGLKVGILCVEFDIDLVYMAQQIADLKDRGAEIVVASFHWGVERTYHHTYEQETYAHAAIDAGANIVYGHHPHVLQEIESYNGGIIYYSLGNFSFGGNDNPSDFDTALISQQVIRDVDGTVRLGECTPVPCSLSSITRRNDFQPTPAEAGSGRYERVMEKLAGTYVPPAPTPTEPEETEAETTAPTVADTTGAAIPDGTAAPTEETTAPQESTEPPTETIAATESTEAPTETTAAPETTEAAPPPAEESTVSAPEA